jgi:predicted DNA-binding ribbon-helix-helix protein
MKQNRVINRLNISRSAILKHSIAINGHKTSVSLENDFWDALRRIAENERISMSALVARIDTNRRQANLSSALRLYILSEAKRSAEAETGTPSHNPKRSSKGANMTSKPNNSAA